MTEKDFGLRVTVLRKKKSISAREMSIAIGQNPGYISNIETGKALPSLSGILAICNFFELTPSEFFDFERQDPKKTNELYNDIMALDGQYVDMIKSVVEVLREKQDTVLLIEK